MTSAVEAPERVSAYRSVISAEWSAQPVKVTFVVLTLFIAAGVGAWLASVLVELSWTVAALALPQLIYLRDNLSSAYHRRPPVWPSWVGWGAWANLVVGLLIAAYAATLGRGEGPRLPDGLLSELLSASLAVALIWTLPMLVPRLFCAASVVVGGVARRVRLRREWFEPDRLYAAFVVAAGTAVVAVGVTVVGAESEGLWVAAGALLLLALACAMAFAHRRTLWGGDEGAIWLRFLPHLPAGLWLVLVPFMLILEGVMGPPAVTITAAVVIGYVLGLAGTAYWAAQRLRRSLVEPRIATTTQWSDSIQAKVAHYVDVHGLSARLIRSINRSDGGVFGITGVRGAGKSALTRRVLHQLEGNYFTLEVTAPVRHDPDMGFFIAVCRSVCAKVKDDLAPILRGPSPGAQALLARRVRNLAVFVLLAGAGVTVLVQLALPSLPTSRSAPMLSKADPHAATVDPLLGLVPRYRTYPVQMERRAIDHLILQIERALAAATEPQQRLGPATRYVLVPNPSTQRFWLLRQRSERGSEQESPARGDSSSTAIADDVAHLRGLVTTEDLYPYGFYGPGLGLSEQDALYYESPDGLDRPQSWMHWTSDVAEHSAIAVPLRHLSRELRSFLHSAAPESAPASEQAAEDTPQDGALYHPLLLSHMILEAFSKADPLLSFGQERLERFGEAVRVYRHLLDGDVVPRSTASVRAGGTVTAPRLQGADPSRGFDDEWLDYRRPTVAVLWTLVTTVVLLLLVGPIGRSLITLARAAVNRRYLDAYAEAENFNEQLIYRSSQETSAGLAWQGMSIGRKRTLAGRDLTLPGLTARYLRFIEKVRPIYNGKLVIGIDELDKVHDPEQVKALLTEIKGALFAQGTFYLISISEDAARSFRRRLASGRDIFESTFDDVIDIRQMEVEPAVEMLRELEETGDEEQRLPDPCLEVAALFGGGIPREIIRARRTLSYEMTGRPHASRDWAVWTLLREELDQWDGHLGESNLTGAGTIELRTHTRSARQALGDTPQGAIYARIFEAIGACVDVVDPDGLRKSVGYISGSADEEVVPAITRYREIASDLQIVLRLLILTHLCELITDPGSSRADYADRILQCHRALWDKPALAEVLLLDLRETRTTASGLDVLSSVTHDPSAEVVAPKPTVGPPADDEAPPARRSAGPGAASST
jgi:hypothetical protein